MTQYETLEFERINAKGAREFGANWLAANITAQAAARDCGIEPRDQRTLIAAVTLALLRNMAGTHEPGISIKRPAP